MRATLREINKIEKLLFSPQMVFNYKMIENGKIEVLKN